MIQVFVNTGTNQNDLSMLPLSVAEQEAIWDAFQKLAAHAMQPNGKSRYTLGLNFLGPAFHSFCIWERITDYTDPIEEQRLVLSAQPEDILSTDRFNSVLYVLL